MGKPTSHHYHLHGRREFSMNDRSSVRGDSASASQSRQGPPDQCRNGGSTSCPRFPPNIGHTVFRDLALDREVELYACLMNHIRSFVLLTWRSPYWDAKLTIHDHPSVSDFACTDRDVKFAVS